MSLTFFLLLCVRFTLFLSVHADFVLPSFNRFRSEYTGDKPDNDKRNGQEAQTFDFGEKSNHTPKVELNEFGFGGNPNHTIGEEIEEVNFVHKPDYHKAQEVEEINFGYKSDHPKGLDLHPFRRTPDHFKRLEADDISFRQAPDHFKRLEADDISFRQAPDHFKRLEADDISFRQAPDHFKRLEADDISFRRTPDLPKGLDAEDISFRPDRVKRQEAEEINFGYKPHHHKRQEIEEINFGHKPDHHRGQEVEEINFGHKPHQHNGQEIEEINFGHKPDYPKGQEIEEINFGHKPDDLKGQEVEEINFGYKPDHPKGQEVEEINFGHKPDHHRGQEVEEINFGHKPHQHNGQEVEEINFGYKPDHPKGQEVEEINFGYKPHHLKGQEVEEINFGHMPDHPKGQEIEEINFGYKPHHPKGQEVEEINFGHLPDHPKGQEVEEINFGHMPDHPKGQEIEEINFGYKPHHPKGQEVEEINFGHVPDHPKGQEIEEINFGYKPDHPKGQAVEEINFGYKPDHPKGQEVEEINFGYKPDHPKGQEVEEINFGYKPHHPKGQEVEEINFGYKPDHPKGQEVEEINFGYKPDHPKGQEVEEINFGYKPDHPKGQEVEEINFGYKPDHPKGQEVEEINFGYKPHHPKGQEVEEINFGHMPDHPKGQEIEEINFGHKPDDHKRKEVEEIHFVPKPDDQNEKEVEEFNFPRTPDHVKEQTTEEVALEPAFEDAGGVDTKNVTQDLKGEGENEQGEENSGHFFGDSDVKESECVHKPKVPSNAILRCNSGKDCVLTCEKGYNFPKGVVTVELTCEGHKWISSENVILECNPVCEPPCENNGTCIAPNQCQCPKDFEGAKCELGHKPCSNRPPVPQNSYANCNSSNCLVKCFDNYSFPDGSSTADLACEDGVWGWVKKDWNSLLECKPSCDPPCVNGGTCLDYNKCQCPRHYVGPQCQYELAACDAKKLNFNGYYTCEGKNDHVSCTLSCPEGHDVEEPLAKEYICEYSVGKFFPEPVPKCIYGNNTGVMQFASSSLTVQEGFNGFTINEIPHNFQPLSVGVCSSWKRAHYKNFDGSVFSFDGKCSYTLVEDISGNTFRVTTENFNCELTCSRVVKIYYEDQEYKVRYEVETPTLIVGEKMVDIPHKVPGISVEQMGDEVLVSLQAIDVTITLNKQDDVSIVVNENMMNRTGGLCGNFNNDPRDDFNTPYGSPASHLENFLLSWVENTDNCNLPPTTRNNCTNLGTPDYCKKVFKDVHFEKCYNAGIFGMYEEACEWDLCNCGKSCACETVSEFVKNCKNYLLNQGFPDTTSNWRHMAECPLDCGPGKVYSACGASFQTTCGSFGNGGGLAKYSECVEGCFCPEGLVQFNDSCIEKEYCPCKWRNKFYDKGEKITKDCNTCTCQNGEWTCSNLKCSSRCSVIGSSHYCTFDGKRYELATQCSYYLLKSENYAIESENLPCEGNFADEIFQSYISKLSPCTKLVTIRHKTDEIKLKTNKEVLVNGVEAPTLPLDIDGVVLRSASLYVIVTLPDGTEVWWDGRANVYIDLPENHTGTTGGLCGTSNNNQRDDFGTPEGDIEQTAEHFAEKWKTDETCIEINPLKSHPCDANPGVKTIAEKHCQKLKSSTFKDCHPHVDVDPFYKNCLHDVCSCQKEAKYCFCSIFADYASECIRNYVDLPWRNDVRECGLHCPPGQIYLPNGDSCARSCQDIAITEGRCDRKQSEGCGCPGGLVLNPVNQCVPVYDCPCFHQDFKYRPEHELIMESDEGPRFCICRNAVWSCRPATALEIARDYENSDLKCDEKLHEEYTTCKPAEAKTCKNMHEKPKHSTRICFPGCVCKKGFVWDSIGERCVNASECPCHHGGRSYADGEKIQQECNSCTCGNGKWSCTTRECSAVCSTWGDSHFKTFDGNVYDFQGSCEFVLASGVISEFETFLVSLQIVPCGSSGTSCPKSVTLTVGSPLKEEKVEFRKSNSPSIPRGLERIMIREVGIFVFAEVFDLGISVKWDRGTRVYIKADSRWKGRVVGLCGNFNDNELDDFKTPSSGETSEISPVLFADSWRLHPYCPETNPITDTCAQRPHRKAWATQKCSILKSETFEACHSEVPVEPYLERCVVDSCGCDDGGDCECMCTALAAYTEECARRGVPIKWRTQELCPLQCDDGLIYEPCVSACPPKSCDNQFQHFALIQTCSEESCVEGCERPHCPAGEVLAKSSSNLCVPIASCQTVCLTVNNTTYLEGDLMESDDCHSCYCSHHAKVCTGKPCHEITSTPPSLPPTSACPEDQVWDDCIVKCDHRCNNLKQTSNGLQCSHANDCISGCRGIDLQCSAGMFLRDIHTCVHKKDCPCTSPSGLFLKPGEVVQEGKCEKCQCINNEFECHNVCTAAPLLSTPEPMFNYTKKKYPATTNWDFAQEGNVTLIYYTTLAPPVTCPNGHYESLIDNFSRFSASSYLNGETLPAFSQMNAINSWEAAVNNGDQYLQVDLGRAETILAVNVAGHSTNYVSSYHLLHSLNGVKFVDIIGQNGEKEVFGGPIDGHHSVKQVLRNPIEARYIRFHPIVWHGRISMKVDVLGCRYPTTSTTPNPATSPSPVCNERIGIGHNQNTELQVLATSYSLNHGPDLIGLDNEIGWQSLTNSKTEWVQIDFKEYGNFSGIITKGVPQAGESHHPSWVERFKVEYSHDGLSWNPVLDEFGDETVFMGNTDSEAEKINYFRRPIHAKFLKISPVKWHRNIAMRLDVMGCYEPPNPTSKPLSSPIPPSECNVCSGAAFDQGKCPCRGEEWWDGENCVSHSECPCFVGLIAYPVGASFTTENCEECICKVYGLPHCVPKHCPDCPEGLQKIVTPLCGCTCKPCEKNTRLCTTSNICLEESAWCNGVQDCPDDELNCTPTDPEGTPKSNFCTPSCPPGYKVLFRNKTAGPSEADDMLYSQKVKSVKSTKSVKTYRKPKRMKKLKKPTECPPYDCVPMKEVPPTQCPAPECPLDYAVIHKKQVEELEDSCPLYACEPIPELASCSVSSKNIQTFDGTEYKYEICDHVLVTHDSEPWNITLVKNCKFTLSCTNILLIHHGDHLLELHPHDQFVKVDSFPYSKDQVELLNSKIEDFRLNPLGNSVIFTSFIYGFEIIYDTNGNIKIQVPGSMKGHLAGLCGSYNGYPADDKRRPDGKVSKTTVDFGDSWLNSGGEECTETVCSIEKQAIALGICLKLKEKPFDSCSHPVNLELCVELTCQCFNNNRTEEDCRCQSLSDFATKCKSSSLFGWRVEFDCPSSCPEGFVHHDCYPYACQPSCGNECTEPAPDCYSGCFCPDGLVKRGEKCIKMSDCRDCVCSGMGDSTYLTFDGGLTFSGNCTYVATREKTLSPVSGFEVLISNRLCNGSDFMTCTYKMEVKVPGHSIKIISLPNTEQGVEVFVDEVVQDLHENENLERTWGGVVYSPETSFVHVTLPTKHVDIRYFYKRFSFSISLPSHLYSEKVEGLCGGCYRGDVEFEKMDHPEVWQAEKGECLIEPPTSCTPTAEGEKICLLLNRPDVFGQCLPFVDSTPFLDQCLALACDSGNVCSSLEAYGQACRDAGVCVEWRSHDLCPFECPSDLQYVACNNGCPITCDNYNELPQVCTSSPVEGCFCPSGQLLINGTCQSEKYCEYCDEEGKHYDGDLWVVDKCTNCTCKNEVITCDKTECPGIEIICGEDEIVVKEEYEFECCPKYKCGCKPREQCPEMEKPKQLLPGMEIITNVSGCCPKMEVVCLKENCPHPEPCSQHFIQKAVNTTNCCPDYHCERPPNLCIYEFGATENTTTRVKRDPRRTETKEIGEWWLDGSCKKCVCVDTNGFAEAICTVTECLNLEDHPYFHDFELVEVSDPQKCCPDVIRKSCKHNGRVYKVGDAWIPDEKNPCETMKCNDWGDGNIVKDIRLEMCNKECELGWEYRELEGSCCGRCVQKGCIVGNEVYQKGEFWHSEDKCSKSSCVLKDGHFTVITEVKSCASIEGCPPEDIYQEDCCLKCKIRAEDKKVCFPQLLPVESTVNLLKVKKGKHGLCQNIQPIQNFTRCAGNCDSFTEYKAETGSHESVCSCCKPQEYSLVEVDLKCADGLSWKKKITVPSKCSCMPCGR